MVPEPDVVSHAASVEVLKDKPEVVEVRFTFCGAGKGPVTAALNVREVGEMVNLFDEDCVTLIVTGIETGLLATPNEAKLTVVLYVPGKREEAFAWTLTVPGDRPVTGAMVNQEAGGKADQAATEVSLVPTCTLWLVLVDPAGTVNTRLD